VWGKRVKEPVRWTALVAIVVIGVLWMFATQREEHGSQRAAVATAEPTNRPAISAFNYAKMNAAFSASVKYFDGTFAQAGFPHIISSIEAHDNKVVTVTVDADEYGIQSAQDQRRMKQVLADEAVTVWRKYAAIPPSGLTLQIKDLSNEVLSTDYGFQIKSPSAR